MKKEIKEDHPGDKAAIVWYPQEVLDRIDRLAKRGGVTRSHLMRNLVVIGVEYLEGAEKFGLLQTSLVLRDFGEWFKAKLESRLLSDHAKKA